MVSVSVLKIKLLTILSMVFMGLFSRFVLGFPLILPGSTPSLQIQPQGHQLPASGSRTSLRLLPALRREQKRRHGRKDGKTLEEELTFFHTDPHQISLDFIGEVIENERRDS